jgi:hypothetical protein
MERNGANCGSEVRRGVKLATVGETETETNEEKQEVMVSP